MARALFANVKIKYLALEQYQLKDAQEEVLDALLDGKDAIVQLPTGYGKTLIYALYPLMLQVVSTNFRIFFPCNRN